MRRLLPVLALFACSDPRPPTICAGLPQVRVFVGDRETVEPCFSDPEGGALSLSVAVDNPEIATATVAEPRIHVDGKSPGVNVIAITATNTEGLTATQDQYVLVPNRPPEGTPLDDVRLRPGTPLTIDLAAHFSDPDGQPLAYTASSSAPEIVHAALSDDLLTLTAGGRPGTPQITVTASDGGLSLTVTFDAAVKVPVAVLEDEFDSERSLKYWILNEGASARIEEGRFVLTADSGTFASKYAVARQELGGEAENWTVEITLRVIDEDARAGFLVETGDERFPALLFVVGGVELGQEEANWMFAFQNGDDPVWYYWDWSYGTSEDIDEFSDTRVSLAVNESGVRATVGGELLFEHGTDEPLVGTAVAVGLVTLPEIDDGVTRVSSSMDDVRVLAEDFTR